LKKLILFFLLTISNISLAQKKLSVDDQFVQLGDELFNFGAKKDAKDLYLQAIESNGKNLMANYMAGRCYLETIEKNKCVPYFLKAYEIDKNVSPDILFKIASGYHFGAEFENAIKYYTMYKESITQAKVEKMQTTIQEEKLMCEKRIYECKNGLQYYANPKNLAIQNLGSAINTEYAEYAVAISADQSTMIFTSRRDGGVGQNKDVDNEFFEDIWMSKKMKEKWTRPKNLGKNVNTPSHDASIGFSPDGKTLFVYKPDNNGDIYFSNKLNDTSWSIPLNMGSPINSRYTEPSVSISSDGKTLYFSSDRPGGLGKMDIYKSELMNDGKWGKAVNMGSKINTAYDDDSPYIDADGKTLFFSSRGHNGMGGYDIYKSVFDPTNLSWTIPENLGYPINSPDNDIFFVISGDGKTGYYASAKEGGYGSNDIYTISMSKSTEMTEFVKQEVKIEFEKPLTPLVSKEQIGISQPITICKGKVVEDSTKIPLEVNVKISDTKTLQTVANTFTKSDGSFEIPILSGVDYQFEVEKTGYLYYSENFTAPFSNEFQIIVKDANLKKIVKGSKIILKNVFFDLGKAHLRDESKLELELLFDLLSKNPSIMIEVSGHTDNIGSAEDNLKLSTDRAKEVYNYLILKGVKSEKLRYAGYGKDKPIATNDTELGRQKNRRTEFEIIGY
jgi:outer membrane protein OmpA-like peptidoglycan-associated protein